MRWLCLSAPWQEEGRLKTGVVHGRRIPSATYRLQFNGQFTFRDALRIVPYLHELGITDVYSSPIFRARPGSTHGYDVVDPGQLNPEIGTEEDFAALTTALRARDMGFILDVVPNHMGLGVTNPWWMDVLENGPSSPYALYFDIDWHPSKPELANKMLLPMLDDQYGKVLESQKFQLSYSDGSFVLDCHDKRLPLAPRTYSLILAHVLQRLQAILPQGHEQLLEFHSILTALSYLPPRTETDAVKITERFREKEIIKRRLAALCGASPQIRAALDIVVRTYNGIAGDPRSFDLLDELIEAQAYRIAFWRVATDEINYRRFFDINDLAAICEERAEVFEAVHNFTFRLLAEDKVTGLRVDHPDGLWDPKEYFRKLQAPRSAPRSGARPESENVEEGPPMPGRSRRVYLLAEKILSAGEPLPQDWAVDGTTGYDFLNAVNGLFVDAARARVFTQVYTRFTGQRIEYRDLVNSAKKMIMLVSLASEIQMLSHRLDGISERNRRYRDFTLNSLTFALREVIAALPVYRTYITGSTPASERDQRYIEQAVAEAKQRNPRTARAIFNFIGETLLLRNLADFREEDRPKLVEFVMKFQQVTGPVMSKAVEDTAFYRYTRLVSLNEVGGQPDEFGGTVAAFHRQNEERCRSWPHSLLATSTHDTKRSEDVRARINVLSEIPDDWRRALSRWRRFNAGKKTLVDGAPAPSRNDEYLLYQTLLGAWPLTDAELPQFCERIVAYMQKATKEAKVHTSWVNPNDAYDAATQAFVRRVLESDPRNRFLQDFLPFQHRLAFFSRLNVLSQQLLKLTAPGVPDLYQGTEIFDLSLVDPDNRRPIDYQRRRALLTELDAGWPADPDRMKLFLTHTVLVYRRAHGALFTDGDYVPLAVAGERQEHIIAFARCAGDQAAVVVCPRLTVGLTSGVEEPPLGETVWGNTRVLLPPKLNGATFRNLFSGEEFAAPDALRVAAALARFPVALLAR